MISDPLKRLRELLREVPDLDSSDRDLWVTDASECLNTLDEPNEAHELLRYADGSHPEAGEMSEPERRDKVIRILEGVLAATKTQRSLAGWSLTQSQLTLLRKLVEISTEDDSREFIVYELMGKTPTASFFGTKGPVRELDLSRSDLNELKRSGHIETMRYNNQGEEVLQVVNEAFELFRDTAEFVSDARFKTGDPDLDELLDTAVTKYQLQDHQERKDALDKLWDAWERLKSLDAPDKKTSIAVLIGKAASEPIYNSILETEARVLTKIGNDFQIRHSEKGKLSLSDPHQVDYFFERMFSLVRHLLKKSGRL